MAFKIRKHGTVIASFATAQAVDISHANDSIAIGDGTDLLDLVDVTGVKSIPVKVTASDVSMGGDASASNQTSGAQKTQIVDSGGVVAGISDVAGAKAIKVDVIQMVSGASGLTDAELRATAVPVSGTFYQATQPVSGTFWQATQPVSGTFWQAIQPVSAASLPLPTGASTEATLASILTAAQLLDDLVATDDAAFAVGSKVMPFGAVMDDAATDSVDEGDIGYLRMTSSRQLWTVVGGISAGDNNIGNVDIVTLPGTVETDIAAIKTAIQLLDNAVSGNEYQVDVLTLPGVAGDVANDGADSGNPIKVGGIAKNANPTSVANNDRVNAYFDLAGRLVVTESPRELVIKGNCTLTNTTETTLVAAAASIFHDLAFLMLTNTSATAVRADIRDTTAGTVLFSVALAANGGAVIPFPVPIPQTTVNTNWTVTLSASVTDVRCLGVAVKRV